MGRTIMGLCLSLLLAFALASCDVIGGDSGGGVSLNNSSWFGTLEDNTGSLFTIRVDFDGDGNISGIFTDGTSVGVTGTVEKVQGSIFGFTLSNGVEGGFLAKGSHAVFLDEIFNFGVVEKDATSLAASYSEADLVGNWSGKEVLIESPFELLEVNNSSATVNSDLTFDGEGGNDVTFNGSVTLNDPDFGRYIGTYTNSIGESGDVRVFLTPDKQFAGSWACSGGTFPDDCGFNSWD